MAQHRQTKQDAQQTETKLFLMFLFERIKQAKQRLALTLTLNIRKIRVQVKGEKGTKKRDFQMEIPCCLFGISFIVKFVWRVLIMPLLQELQIQHSCHTCPCGN